MSAVPEAVDYFGILQELCVFLDVHGEGDFKHTGQSTFSLKSLSVLHLTLLYNCTDILKGRYINVQLHCIT